VTLSRTSAEAARWGHVEGRHLALAAAGCVALGVVGLVDPSRHALAPPCPLRSLTGLDCPLCGATRATHALLQGDVVRALDLNALYVLALPVLAVLVAWWAWTGRAAPVTERRAVRWAVVVLVVAFAVARNLPPFTVLGT
jgi:hypothetical protein